MDRVVSVKQLVKDKLFNEATGHDYYHALRVLNVARKIAHIEGGDIEMISVCALIHDLIDYKLFDDLNIEKYELTGNLIKIGFSDKEIEEIFSIIENISYSKGNIPNSIEGKIVQDADRLDAIGAMGIARAFAYGGKKNRPIYDEKNIDYSTIGHFYDKLFKLKGLMNTETGKSMAKKRTLFMEEFIDQFYKEWNTEDI